MRAAAASRGLQLLWAMPERPGELPPILSSSAAVLDQPHVIGIIVNTRSDGFMASLTGGLYRPTSPPHSTPQLLPPKLPPDASLLQVHAIGSRYLSQNSTAFGTAPTRSHVTCQTSPPHSSVPTPPVFAFCFFSFFAIACKHLSSPPLTHPAPSQAQLRQSSVRPRPLSRHPRPPLPAHVPPSPHHRQSRPGARSQRQCPPPSRRADNAPPAGVHRLGGLSSSASPRSVPRLSTEHGTSDVFPSFSGRYRHVLCSAATENKAVAGYSCSRFI
jgi:hypothetical protein